MRNFSHIGQSCEYFEEPDHNPDEVTMDDITAQLLLIFKWNYRSIIGFIDVILNLI